MSTTLKRHEMFIGGEWTPGTGGETQEIINPATGKVIATAPLGGKEDVDRAVKAAQDAFDAPKGWSSFAATEARRSRRRVGTRPAMYSTSGSGSNG